ncbi:MAG: hypothetical protein JF604_17835 [Bradyrhizobium sp.]|nr:hypothetical protein [Bradyrhizobium sp.]
MTKAIEHIVAGYSSLKNRKALEEIRDHRRRLLNDYRMRSGSGLNFDWINSELQEEIGLVEDALSKLGDEHPH